MRPFGFDQFGAGSIDRATSRRQENHEAIQHTRPVQENIPRIKTVETPATRKCWSMPLDGDSPPRRAPKADNLQIISLSDIFISPLEDMYAFVIIPCDKFNSNMVTAVISSQSCWAPISTDC